MRESLWSAAPEPELKRRLREAESGGERPGGLRGVRGVQREDGSIGLRGLGRWDPGRRVSGGGPAYSAAQARPAGYQELGLGPTTTAGPSTTSPEWRPRQPGILPVRGARSWRSCPPRAGERRARRPAEARRRDRACSRGPRADGAGAWPAPLAAPPGPLVLRWPPGWPWLCPACPRGRQSRPTPGRATCRSVKFLP